MDLKEEAALGAAIDGHWYYVSKAHMVEAHVKGPGRRLLDVGAGSGWFSRWLLRRDIAGEAVCVDPGYEADRDESVEGRPLLFRRRVEATDADLVLLMDVLEHVDDDVGLLSSYARLAQPGTEFLITVPAFTFMWSAHDDYLEHRRRYTLSQLRAVVAEAGLKDATCHYYFAAIFPVAVIVRLIGRLRRADRSDMRPAPAWLNAVLIRVLSLERAVMRANRAFGLSVVCRCRR